MTVQAMSVQPAPGEEAHTKPRLNCRTMLVLGSMNLIDCINANLLTPYVDLMVSTFLNKSPESPEVAHVVTLLIGLYPLTEAMVSPFWGMFADRAGRRPCLLVGLGASAVVPIIFGMGQSLPAVFAARALDAFFCGNTGVTRTYLGEIVDSSNEAKGFAILGNCFSLGLIIGPVLGGSLVFPARWAPGIFAGTIFDAHPFLLPNLAYALFAASVWVVGALFLEETLPREQRCFRRRAEAEGASDATSSGAVSSRCCPWATLQTMIGYWTMSGGVAATRQLLIVVLSYGRDVDGFAFGPHQLGVLQNIGAVGLIVCQSILYPRMAKRLGFLPTYLIGFTFLCTCFNLLPLIGLFADPERYGKWRWLPLGAAFLFHTGATALTFPTAFAFVNRASAGTPNRGAINGYTASGGALSRAMFPPLAALILGRCTLLGPFGRYIPFYVVTLVMIMGLLLAWPGMRKMDKKVIGGAQPRPPAPASEEDERRESRQEPLIEGGEQSAPRR